MKDFNEYLREVRLHHAENVGIRAGQAYWNCLPDDLRAEFLKVDDRYRRNLDPFYNNEAIPRFLTWVAERWSDESRVREDSAV